MAGESFKLPLFCGDLKSYSATGGEVAFEYRLSTRVRASGREEQEEDKERKERIEGRKKRKMSSLHQGKRNLARNKTLLRTN